MLLALAGCTRAELLVEVSSCFRAAGAGLDYR